MYVYGSYVQGEAYESCLDNISDTFKLLRELGFVIHTEKLLLTPSQIIFSLGFIISLKTISLPFTNEKKNKIKNDTHFILLLLISDVSNTYYIRNNQY